jgi:hypothetical protein
MSNNNNKKSAVKNCLKKDINCSKFNRVAGSLIQFVKILISFVNSFFNFERNFEDFEDLLLLKLLFIFNYVRACLTAPLIVITLRIIRFARNTTLNYKVFCSKTQQKGQTTTGRLFYFADHNRLYMKENL